MRESMTEDDDSRIAQPLQVPASCHPSHGWAGAYLCSSIGATAAGTHATLEYASWQLSNDPEKKKFRPAVTSLVTVHCCNPSLRTWQKPQELHSAA
jgi:hypothetical protein